MVFSTFVAPSTVLKGTAYLSDFASLMDDILTSAVNGSTGLGLELLLRDKLSEFEYADGIVFLADSVQAVQYNRSLPVVEASWYGMQFAPSKCKVILPYRQELVSASLAYQVQLT